MIRAATERALARLLNWSEVYALRQLGEISRDGGERASAVDTARSVLMLRAEIRALRSALEDKALIGPLEFEEHLEVEADKLTGRLEQQFPGFKATPAGLDTDMRATETMAGWRQ